jgi:hypothetical protein
VQERNEGREEGYRYDRPRRKSLGASQQRRKTNRAKTEGKNQRTMDKKRKAFLLIGPKASNTEVHRSLRSYVHGKVCSRLSDAA